MHISAGTVNTLIKENNILSTLEMWDRFRWELLNPPVPGIAVFGLFCHRYALYPSALLVRKFVTFQLSLWAKYIVIVAAVKCGWKMNGSGTILAPVLRTCCSNYWKRDRTDARFCGPKRDGAEWTAVAAAASGRSATSGNRIHRKFDPLSVCIIRLWGTG